MAQARTSDPETSHEAAQSITESKEAVDRKRVRYCLSLVGPMMHWQIEEFCEEMGWVTTSQSLRSRLAEMTRWHKGRPPEVEWTGEYGQSPFGRRARIWRMIP